MLLIKTNLSSFVWTGCCLVEISAVLPAKAGFVVGRIRAPGRSIVAEVGKPISIRTHRGVKVVLQTVEQVVEL